MGFYSNRQGSSWECVIGIGYGLTETGRHPELRLAMPKNAALSGKIGPTWSCCVSLGSIAPGPGHGFSRPDASYPVGIVRTARLCTVCQRFNVNNIRSRPQDRIKRSGGDTLSNATHCRRASSIPRARNWPINVSQKRTGHPNMVPRIRPTIWSALALLAERAATASPSTPRSDASVSFSSRRHPANLHGSLAGFLG